MSNIDLSEFVGTGAFNQTAIGVDLNQFIKKHESNNKKVGGLGGLVLGVGEAMSKAADPFAYLIGKAVGREPATAEQLKDYSGVESSGLGGSIGRTVGTMGPMLAGGGMAASKTAALLAPRVASLASAAPKLSGALRVGALAAEGVAGAAGASLATGQAPTRGELVTGAVATPVLSGLFSGIRKGYRGIQETIANIDDVTKNTLSPTRAIPVEKQSEIVSRVAQSKLPKLEEYLNIARRAAIKADAPTPLERAGQRATDAIKKLQSFLGRTGEQKRQILSRNADKLVDIAPAIAKFDDAMARIGVTFDDAGAIISEKGRGVALDAADKSVLVSINNMLNSAKQSNTAQFVDDIVDNMQDILFKGRQVGVVPMNSSVSGALKSVSGVLNNTVKKTVGGRYAQLNQKYANVVKLLDRLNRAIGEEGKRGGSLMKRVFSPQDSGTKSMLAKLQQITGDDLIEEAVLAKFAMEAVGDVRQTNLLQNVIDVQTSSGIVSKFLDMTGRAIADKQTIARNIATEMDIDKNIVSRVLSGERTGVPQEVVGAIAGFIAALSNVSN